MSIGVAQKKSASLPAPQRTKSLFTQPIPDICHSIDVYKRQECILRGYTEAFIDAGCIVSTPTCGPCLGGHMGCLAAGERCVSTTNRNFVGRMGHVDSEVYLASPAVAAASGVAGHICHPEEVMSK